VQIKDPKEKGYTPTARDVKMGRPDGPTR